MGVPHPVVMDDHGDPYWSTTLVTLGSHLRNLQCPNASTSAGWDRWDWSQAICHHLGVKNQLGQGKTVARKRVTYWQHSSKWWEHIRYISQNHLQNLEMGISIIYRLFIIKTSFFQQPLRCRFCWRKSSGFFKRGKNHPMSILVPRNPWNEIP